MKRTNKIMLLALSLIFIGSAFFLFRETKFEINQNPLKNFLGNTLKSEIVISGNNINDSNAELNTYILLNENKSIISVQQSYAPLDSPYIEVPDELNGYIFSSPNIDYKYESNTKTVTEFPKPIIIKDGDIDLGGDK